MKSFLAKTTDAESARSTSAQAKINKRSFYFLIPAAALCIVLFLALTQTSRSFHSFTEDLFRLELSENTLSMHYTIAYPENFGLEDAEVTLPAFTPENKASRQKLLSDVLGFLHSLNPKLLNAKDAYTCLLYTSPSPRD